MIIEPEEEAPLVLNLNAVQRVYQTVEIEDDEGNIDIVKMQATKEYKDLLNGLVYSLLSESITAASEKGRTTLWAEDLPIVQEV